MAETVDISIPVSPDAAARFADPSVRKLVVEAVHDLLAPASLERLFQAMDDFSAIARARGLTDEILEEELAAYNAERRERPASAAE